MTNDIFASPRADRLAHTFVLVDYQDRPIYPIRLMSGAFQLAPRGSKTHHKEHAIEVTDEDRAFAMVASGTYKIRAVRGRTDAPSLLGVGDRAVKSIVRK